MEEKKIAVLIDAENTSHRYLKTIFEEIQKEGTVTIKRLYGDLTATNLSPYKEAVLEHALTAVQSYAYTTNKNSSDSTLIIDAMDVLYRENVDVFCLVSSDSDFTGLAKRLRESGKTVIGMGREQTPLPFVKSCSRFIYLDLISNDSIVSESDSQDNIQDVPSAESSPSAPSLEEIKETIIKILSEEVDDDDEWMLVTALTMKLQKYIPNFDVRYYGCTKMTTFLQDKLKFEINKVHNPKSKYKGACDAYIKIPTVK